MSDVSEEQHLNKQLFQQAWNELAKLFGSDGCGGLAIASCTVNETTYRQQLECIRQMSIEHFRVTHWFCT